MSVIGRWPILVCPECGMVAPPFMDVSYQCESDHPPRNLEVVEVVPASQLEGAVKERDSQKARADLYFERYRQLRNSLRDLVTDHDTGHGGQ